MTLKGRGSESAVWVFALLCESPQWETWTRFDCLPAVVRTPRFGGASISRLPRLSRSVSWRFVPAQKRLDASLYFSYTCHHLLYNCFEGFRGVLETRKAVNLCCQWAIERRLFPSASALRKVKFTYLRWRVRQKGKHLIGHMGDFVFEPIVSWGAGGGHCAAARERIWILRSVRLVEGTDWMLTSSSFLKIGAKPRQRQGEVCKLNTEGPSSVQNWTQDLLGACQ